MTIEIHRFKAADEYSPEDEQEMRALIAQLPDETVERLLHSDPSTLSSRPKMMFRTSIFRPQPPVAR
ncbi:MAG: hypothetical protein ACYDEV_09285 [Acidiferrobacter sp.]